MPDRFVNGDNLKNSSSNLYLERADTEKTKDEVYKLRYSAYYSVNAIDPNPTKRFRDQYDEHPNMISYILRNNQNGIAIGSIRASIYLPNLDNRVPALDIYSTEIEKEIGINKIFVESNRYTINPDFQNNNHYNIYLFKAIILQLILTQAEYVMTAVRKRHLAFYRRYLKFTPISEEKKYTNLKEPLILLIANAKEALESAVKSFPFIELKMPELEEYNKCGTLRF